MQFARHEFQQLDPDTYYIVELIALTQHENARIVRFVTSDEPLREDCAFRTVPIIGKELNSWGQLYDVAEHRKNCLPDGTGFYELAHSWLTEAEMEQMR